MKKEENKKSWMDNYPDVKEFFKGVPFQGVAPKTDLTQTSSMKVSIWRDQYQNGQLLPIFVYPKELKKEDVIFVESKDFEGYAGISSYEITSEGKLENFNIYPLNFPIERENTMLRVVKKLILAAQEQSKERLNVIVSIRQR
jgi:hypothetical protein